MEKQLLAVCGKDAYSRKLFEYVFSEYGKDYEIVFFSDEAAFSSFGQKDKIRLILAEEDFDTSEVAKGVVRVKLSEDESDKENSKVYKYMPVDKVMKDVMAIYAAGKTAESANCIFGEKGIIGIYTPIKRSFQTTFAITLGQILARKKKTLYLNFESYSGFDVICRNLDRSDLMDLVYFSECDDKNFPLRVDSMKDTIGNLDFISPVKAYVKFASVGAKQWLKLLDNLTTKTDYEYIILDLSEQVNGLMDVLRRCSKIYTITDEDRMASAKIAQYTSMIKEFYYEDILLKTENIRIPKFKEIPAELEMLPYSELANYIKASINFDKEDEDYADDL